VNQSTHGLSSLAKLRKIFGGFAITPPGYRTIEGYTQARDRKYEVFHTFADQR
jgi:hypothetical protein